VNVVVLVGVEPDAAALGAAASAIESAGQRAAVFLGDVTTPEGLAALQELVGELFPDPA
jgi:NAD(P)-dependent dehydrogenase (short-subunit alcohol dehydrogenase family)